MSGEATSAILAHLNQGKLSPPPQRPTVQRPRLAGRLAALAHSKLALLCAEAGYGKTALLLDFLREWPHPVVWYRLGPAERDAPRFGAGLAAAIARHLPERSLGLAERPDSGPNGATVSSLSNGLLCQTAQLDSRPLLLVLDNFEAVIPSREVCALVSDLLEASGPELHVAIASRALPPLPIARFQACQQVVLLGWEELAFDLHETRELLLGLQAARISEAQVEKLFHRTEGWPAGLAMAAEALHTGAPDDVMAAIEDPAAPLDLVGRYFADEVFEEEPAEIKEFLVTTSIFKTLFHDVVNDFLGIENAGERLSAMRRGGLFTRALDPTGASLRYHPLFRAFLLQKLHEGHGNERIRDLHQHAALAACRHRCWGEAVDLYAAIEDWQRVGELVEGMGEAMMRQEFLETVRYWLGLIPEDQILRRPRLLMLRGRLQRQAGRFPEALSDLNRALQGLDEEADKAAIVLTQVDVALASDALGEFEKGEAVLNEALRRAGDNAALRGQVMATLSCNSIDADELEEGARWGEMAMAAAAGSEAGTSLSLARSLRFYGRALILQGELQRGLQYVSRSVDLCRRERLGNIALGWSLLTLGQGLVLQGSFDAAHAALAEAEAEAPACRPLQDWIGVWRGSAHRGAGHLDEAERDYLRTGNDYPRAARSARLGLAILRLRQGRAAEALHLAEEALRACPPGESPGERAACQTVRGLALAAVGERLSGLEQLAAAAETFRQRGRRQQLAGVQWHIARLLLEEGRQIESLDVLQEAVLWAAARGIYHLWWWEPETIARLWPLAFRAGFAPSYLLELARLRLGPGECHHLYEALDAAPMALRGELMEILRAVSRGSIVHAVAADLLQNCHDPTVRRHLSDALASGVLSPQELAYLRGETSLTWKEVEVLILYYLGPVGEQQEHSGRHQLAQLLGFSEHTLKVHIRSIRRKLDLPQRRAGARLPLALLTQRLQQARTIPA